MEQKDVQNKIKELIKNDSLKVGLNKIIIPITSKLCDVIEEHTKLNYRVAEIALLIEYNRIKKAITTEQAQSYKNSLNIENYSTIEDKLQYSSGCINLYYVYQHFKIDEEPIDLFIKLFKEQVKYADKRGFSLTVKSFFKNMPFLRSIFEPYTNEQILEPIAYCCEDHDGPYDRAVQYRIETVTSELVKKLETIIIEKI